MSQAVQPVPLKIDIVSDVVCPWCIIGYKQLMKALEALSGQFAPTIAWHPFELNPNMPEEGQDLREHIAMKYGSSPAQSSGARSRLTELGAALGFEFDYHDGMRMVNTFRAHQLLYWAGLNGLQTELKLALFAAFFSEHKDISRPEVLVAAAAGVGLDGDEARALLADGRYAPAVREEQGQWLEREVYAVPTFFFQERFPVPGAQEAETFVRVLNKIYAKSEHSVA